jgi:hypothetical protein
VFQYVVMKVPNDVLGLSFGPVVVLSGRPQFRPKMFLCTAIPTTECMTVMSLFICLCAHCGRMTEQQVDLSKRQMDTKIAPHHLWSQYSTPCTYATEGRRLCHHVTVTVPFSPWTQCVVQQGSRQIQWFPGPIDRACACIEHIQRPVFDVNCVVGQ